MCAVFDIAKSLNELRPNDLINRIQITERIASKWPNKMRPNH